MRTLETINPLLADLAVPLSKQLAVAADGEVAFALVVFLPDGVAMVSNSEAVETPEKLTERLRDLTEPSIETTVMEH